MLRRFMIAVSLASALAGCQLPPRVPVPFGFERGGALTAEEYARLEPLARAQPSRETIAVGQPIKSRPLVVYVYSFKPGFDPSGIARLEIGPFHGKPGGEAEIAAELPGALARRLTAAGWPATAVPVGTPGAYVLTGAVTRTGALGPGESPDKIGIQVEAKLTRGDAVMGAMQVNAVGTTGMGGVTPAMLIGTLIASAIEGSRADIVSRHLADILRRVRAGEREGAFGNGLGGMSTPATAGVDAR